MKKTTKLNYNIVLVDFLYIGEEYNHEQHSKIPDMYW